jgi:hypothetical protein
VRSLSPRRSIKPPVGKKALSSCRRVTMSNIVEGATEDVEAVGDGIVSRTGLTCRAMRRGNRGTSVASVAAVTCWFDVRKQALRTAMRASGSSI